MFCLRCSSTDVGDEEVIYFYCKLIVDTIIVNYATCNIMAYLYGGDLGGKYLRIKMRVANIVEGFLYIDGISCNLKMRGRSGERYVQKLCSRNGITFFASDGSVSWNCSADGRRKKAMR